MPTYTYVARDGAGKVFTGSIEAPSKEAVREELSKMRYYAASIADRRKRVLRRWGRGVRRRDLVVFARQFAAVYDAGLALPVALNVIEEEEADTSRLKDIAREVREQIEGGSSLHRALGRHPEVFSDFFLAMIEAGETGGKLNVVLERLATHLESQEELRQKLISAFAYPLVVGVLCCLVVAFLVTFVVPVFASAYAQLGVQLPAPTVALTVISDFSRTYWWAVAGSLAALGVTWRRIRRTAAVQKALDKTKMNAPLLGVLNRKVAVSRFVRTFAVMLRSGVPLVQSLGVAERVAGSYLISTAAQAIRAAVTAGGSASGPMRSHRVFPPIVIQMAAAGEASGTMPEMLEKSADFLDSDIDRVIKRLIVTIEPLLTVVLAAIVGLILLAVYLPMFDILKLSAM